MKRDSLQAVILFFALALPGCNPSVSVATRSGILAIDGDTVSDRGRHVRLTMKGRSSIRSPQHVLQEEWTDDTTAKEYTSRRVLA
jgi:hypothetical protein